MTKLMTAFIANPTGDNAIKLASYARKHPMAECLLSAGEVATLRHAEHLAIEHKAEMAGRRAAAAYLAGSTLG